MRLGTALAADVKNALEKFTSNEELTLPTAAHLLLAGAQRGSIVAMRPPEPRDQTETIRPRRHRTCFMYCSDYAGFVPARGKGRQL